MKTASHVPSGVLTLTVCSTTGNSAAEIEPVAAAIPAATDSATKSRRESSSFLLLSSTMISPLLLIHIDLERPLHHRQDALERTGESEHHRRPPVAKL